MGWHGKILRVNLSAGTCNAESLNMEWAQQYLGQRGLGTKYLATEIDPQVDPLSPDNKLIIATGPLTGTSAATGGRWSAITKGALTGAIACSNSGGQFGGEFKMAGWDLLILEGRAPEPVYLYIENDKAHLLPRGDLWGQPVWMRNPRLRSAMVIRKSASLRSGRQVNLVVVTRASLMIFIAQPGAPASAR